MPRKHKPKSEPGKQSAPRGPQVDEKAGSAAESANRPAKSQAKKEQASNAADAGAAPEQLDAEPE